MESYFKFFPGIEIIKKGLKDLEENKETIDSLLISIASPRLIRLGFKIENTYADAEKKLYVKLEKINSDTAHSQYNSFIRRIVSFSRSYENMYYRGE